MKQSSVVFCVFFYALSCVATLISVSAFCADNSSKIIKTLNVNKVSAVETRLNGSDDAFTSSQLVILQYHHVSNNTPPSTSISPQKFIEHLNFLATHQYQVVDLNTSIDKLRQGNTLPEKAIAITFDDGYLNLMDVALPELFKRGLPATIFVNPGLLSQHKTHYLSWSQLRYWHKKGMTIANHGWFHDYWVRQPDNYSNKNWQKQVFEQIESAEKIIEQEIGVSTRLVAYPYGEYDDWLKAWLAGNDYIGFGQQSGVVAAYSDFTALPRYPASGIYANLGTLKTKLNTLALPIDYQKLPSPIIDTDVSNNPPKLTLNWLNEKWFNTNQFACYLNGNALNIQHSQQQVMITANKILPKGRSRFNCTLPIKEKPGYYYWFSHQWLVR